MSWRMANRAAPALVGTPIFRYACWMWVSAVLAETPSARAICLV
jgi:hypothetical protein